MRSSDERMQRHAGRTLMSRRQALSVTLAGLLSGLGMSRARADQVDPGSQVATARPTFLKLFTASGAGDKDGRDWRNAMPIEALSKEINAARPGAGFLIGFDPAGAPLALDTDQIRINASGAEGNPVFLQAGVMAEGAGIAAAPEPAAAFFKSARPWSLEDFGRRGSSYFALTDGASHLRISGFRIDGTPADGFFKFRGKEATIFEDIVFSDIEAKNVGRVIETDRGAVLRNITVADCRAVGIVRGFARFRNLSDAVLRNLELDAANMDAGGEDVCQLISVVAGENLLFENLVLRNALNQPPPPEEGKKPKYVQGDGIVCERETANVTIRKCHASAMGDGGFDLKSTNVTMEDCTTDSCKFGARIWVRGENVIRRCDFRNPVSRNDTQGACVQAGGTLQIIDSKLHAGPGTVAIHLSHKKNREGPVVVMRGGSIQLDGNGAVVHANGDGVLELHDVMVNGVATTKRYAFEKKEE
jgi:hypothetical protein